VGASSKVSANTFLSVLTLLVSPPKNWKERNLLYLYPAIDSSKMTIKVVSKIYVIFLSFIFVIHFKYIKWQNLDNWVKISNIMDQFGQSSKIVIVEDNTSLAEIYKTRLELLGYKCFVAYQGLDALALIERELPDLVLLDLMVPKVAGDQILEIMRASDWGRNIKVLIISNLNESDAPAGLRDQGIEGYAVKANLSNDEIDRLVDSILKPVDQQEDIVLDGIDT
jgi:CheY-like chemotaxis protein